jgi:flagellar biosynthesis protein FlhB
MACFLVGAAEAAVVTMAAQALELHERKKAGAARVEGAAHVETREENTVPWSRKLKWLASLLWGGALLLCFEHLWHGEVVPWFPFLTAAENPADTAEMLHEMATVGVTMAVIVTLVWVVMLAAVNYILRRPEESSAQ